MSAPLEKAMPTILAVSQDAGLLITRTAVLRRCHAEVVAAEADEAKILLKTRLFDLVVLCHTLSPEDRDELVSLAHWLTNDSYSLEVLMMNELEWGRSSKADHASSQPEALVQKVLEMLAPRVAC